MAVPANKDKGSDFKIDTTGGLHVPSVVGQPSGGAIPYVPSAIIDPEYLIGGQSSSGSWLARSPSTRWLPIADDRTELDKISAELAGLRKLLAEQAKKPEDRNKLDTEVASQLSRILQMMEVKSKDLSARVLLPDQEDLAVALVPAHQLDRLEEYHVDQDVAVGLGGVFGGALLGMIVSTVMMSNFVVTTGIWVIGALLLLLTGGSAAWAIVIRRRSTTIRKRLLGRRTLLREDVGGQPDQPRASEDT